MPGVTLVISNCISFETFMAINACTLPLQRLHCKGGAFDMLQSHWRLIAQLPLFQIFGLAVMRLQHSRDEGSSKVLSDF